jgi:S1-C subfamily serine protease
MGRVRLGARVAPARGLAVASAVWLAAGGAGCPDRTVTAFPESYAGVGLELTVKDGATSVVRVTPGGPAHQAGVPVGAQVLEVDGQPVSNLALADTVARMRGKPGSHVRLKLSSEGSDYWVTLQRRDLTRGAGDGGGYVTRPRASRSP